MPTYSAADIIGATLIAKQPVPIVASPYDDAPTIRTVATGQPVGIVDSYLEPAAGRSGLYWMYYDLNNQPYYTRHHSGWYEVSGAYVPYDPSAGSWWDNLLPGGGEGIGNNLGRLALLGIAIWAGIKYAPGIIKSLKQ